MKHGRLAPRVAAIALTVVAALILPWSLAQPAQAQVASAAAERIETYYQQLMPTIRQAGRLTVNERDKLLGL
jgi:hypothetical protein